MSIENEIQRRIAVFVEELSALVREAAVESVRDALGSAPRAARAVRAVHVAAAPSGRGPGRPKKITAIGERRTPEQIKATVSSVYDYIKAHPQCRSEVVRTALKLPRTAVRDALDRLMEQKKLKMKGTRRAAKCTAA